MRGQYFCWMNIEQVTLSRSPCVGCVVLKLWAALFMANSVKYTLGWEMGGKSFACKFGIGASHTGFVRELVILAIQRQQQRTLDIIWFYWKAKRGHSRIACLLIGLTNQKCKNDLSVYQILPKPRLVGFERERVFLVQKHSCSKTPWPGFISQQQHK